MSKLKKYTFTDFQWCIRFDAKDKNWYVIPIDKPNNKILWNSVDAWHCFPKHNYPHLIFYKDNVRPQTKFWNKMQLDWIWTYLQEIKLRIWEEKFDILIKNVWK